ncbi:MAG: hypothetical protein WD963_01690 [Candidatus Paceibacterota bacterium]
MEKLKALFAHKIVKIIKWAFFVLLAAYFVLVIFRVFHFFDVEKTEEQVAKIHATKLQLSDVMGDNLPPDPGAEADKTVAGIDANDNGIRDDVELAIFREYSDSAKTRAVLLQYALALQMQMTLEVVNTETVVATVEDLDSRANICLWSLSSRDDLERFLEDIEKYGNFVENLQLNTEQRKKYLDDLYEDNLGSYSSSNEGCDLDLSVLPN